MKFLVLIGVWLMCIELFHVEGKRTNLGPIGVTIHVIEHQTAPKKGIVEGNPITFLCDDYSVHPDKHTVFAASFYRNDVQIHDHQKPGIIVFSRYLTIQKMKKEDSGNYTCAYNTIEGEKLTSGPYILKVGDALNASVQSTEPMKSPGFGIPLK